MISSHEVALSFGRAAQRYRQNALVQRAMADWLAEWLPAPAHRGGRALELGAGPGVFTAKLLPWTGFLLATDLSPEMCAEGETRFPHINWRATAAETPPLGPWDWIFSSSMLQWAQRPAATLAAWQAVLNPSGRILGGLFAAPSLAEWASLGGAEGPIEWQSAEQWTTHLRSANLKLLRCESKTCDFEFPSALAFVRSLHRVGAAPRRRLAPERLRALLREYDARFGTASGVRTSWTFFRFEATR